MSHNPSNKFADTSFPATAFRDRTESRTLRGTVIVSYRSLRFESDSATVELPWPSLEVQAGGHNDEQLFFRHPAHPEWSICVADFRVLEHEAFLEQPQLRDQIKNLRRRRQGRQKNSSDIAPFFRPCGTYHSGHVHPSVETLGYLCVPARLQETEMRPAIKRI